MDWLLPIFNSQQYAGRARIQDLHDRLRTREKLRRYDDALLRLGISYYVQERFQKQKPLFHEQSMRATRALYICLLSSSSSSKFHRETSKRWSSVDMLFTLSKCLYIEVHYSKRNNQTWRDAVSTASISFSDLINPTESPFIPYAWKEEPW